MISNTEKDAEYLAYLVNAIRVCANYRPKLGHGAKEGYSLREFQEMYQSDPFYNSMIGKPLVLPVRLEKV